MTSLTNLSPHTIESNYELLKYYVLYCCYMLDSNISISSLYILYIYILYLHINKYTPYTNKP